MVEVMLMIDIVLLVSSEVVPPMTWAMVEIEALALPALVMVLVCKLVDPPETWVRVTGQTVVLSSITTVVMTSDSAGVIATPAAALVLDALASDDAAEATRATEEV